MKHSKTDKNCNKLTGNRFALKFSLKNIPDVTDAKAYIRDTDGIIHETFPFFNHHKCHANLADPAIFMPIMEISEIKIQIS